MKIVAIAAEQFDGYQDVTVKFRIVSNEELELSDTDRLLDCLREVGGQAERKSQPYTEQERTDKLASDAEALQGGRRRRGAANPIPSPSPASEAEMETTSSDRRRRRGSTAAQEDVTHESQNSANENPIATSSDRATEGRRRGSPTEPAQQPQASAASAGGRRRSPTANPTPTPATATSTSAKITDADLSKACSQGALALGPDGVLAILGEFGVKRSNELDEKQRQPFLDALQEDIEKAEAAKQTTPRRRG